MAAAKLNYNVWPLSSMLLKKGKNKGYILSVELDFSSRLNFHLTST